jgi:MFS family permease
VWLIITRGFQGVGAAIASPTALSLIATNFPEGRERNRAMGVYAAMSGGGGAVGLLLGGILTDLRLVALDLLRQRAHRRPRAVPGAAGAQRVRDHVRPTSTCRAP